MLHLLDNDILIIIITYTDLNTYLNFKLLNKDLYHNLNIYNLYYYFTKDKIKYKLNSLYNRECNNNIIHCTSYFCSNKLHNYKKRLLTRLTNKELSNETLEEYKNILNNLIRINTRHDKTLTTEYYNLCKNYNIKEVPYCEECLYDHMPEQYDDIMNLLFYQEL